MKSIETEIMDIAQEECAEVIQAISKVRRFSFDEVYNGKSNRAHLEEEIGDLQCMFQLMEEKGLINWSNVSLYAQKKREKLRTWSNVL